MDLGVEWRRKLCNSLSEAKCRCLGDFSEIATFSLLDLAPTFLHVAGITYPDVYNIKKVVPMLGESSLPYLTGKAITIHRRNYVFGMEHDGQSLVIKGKWKITNISDPFDENAFALYDLSKDIGETNDLKGSNPRIFKMMMKEWRKFKIKTGTIL